MLWIITQLGAGGNQSHMFWYGTNSKICWMGIVRCWTVHLALKFEGYMPLYAWTGTKLWPGKHGYAGGKRAYSSLQDFNIFHEHMLFFKWIPIHWKKKRNKKALQEHSPLITFLLIYKTHLPCPGASYLKGTMVVWTWNLENPKASSTYTVSWQQNRIMFH